MPPSDPQEEISALRARIDELQEQLSQRASSADLSELRRQLDAAREELKTLREAAPPSTIVPSVRRTDGFFEVD